MASYVLVTDIEGNDTLVVCESPQSARAVVKTVKEHQQFYGVEDLIKTINTERALKNYLTYERNLYDNDPSGAKTKQIVLDTLNNMITKGKVFKLGDAFSYKGKYVAPSEMFDQE